MEIHRHPEKHVRPILLVGLVAPTLLGLPIAVWLDMRNLADSSPQRQANDRIR